MVEPTPTERRLQQSLPKNIRNRPPEEVVARQTLRGGMSDPRVNTISGGGSSRRPEVIDEQREKTLDTLKKEQEVIKVAESKSGLTRVMFQRELKKRGVTVTELRRATREARQRFRQGDNIQAEARETVKPRVGTEIATKQEQQAREWFVDVAPKRTLREKIIHTRDSIIERATGKKPNQLFFDVTGSDRTVVDKATPPVILSEIAQTPLRVTRGVGATFGILAERGSRKVLPEGVTVTMKGEPQENITITEPQFGTITRDSTRGLITRNITTQGRATRDVQIFEPKRIGQGVSAGTQLGTALVFPTATATGTFAEGMETALDTSKTKQERFLGSAEAVLSAGFLGFRAGSWWKTPTRNVKVVRPQAEDVTTSVSIPKKTVNLRGKTRVQTRTTSKTFGEIGDELLITDSTKGRDLLGLRPLRQRTVKPQKFEVKTVGSQVDNQPFFAEEFVEGKKYTTLLKISPSQPKVVTTNNYGRLSRVEKFTVRRLLERRYGIPVSDKSVVRLLRERNVVITESEVKALGRVSLKDNSLFFRPTKQGRRTNKVLSAEESFFGDSEEALQVTSGLSVSKDVTKPLSRATGKTPVSQRYSLNVGIKPSIPKEAPNIFSPSGQALKPAKIKKTPITSTFPLQEARQTPVNLGSVVRARVKPRKIPQAEPVLETKLIEGIAPSSFAGLGLYEQQRTLSTSRIKPSTNNKDLIKPVVIPTSKPSVSQKDFFGTSPTSETDIFQNNFVGDDVSSSSSTKQSSLSTTAQKSLQKQQTTQNNTTQRTPRTKSPQKSRGASIIKPFSSLGSSQKDASFFASGGEKGYIPQVKDKGKWRSIGKKVLTKSQAQKLGAYLVDNTTSARFRIKPSKKQPVKTNFRGDLSKFRDYKIRKGKRIPLKNTFIERKGKARIDTVGEKRGLSVARFLAQKRKKSRTKKNMFGI